MKTFIFLLVWALVLGLGAAAQAAEPAAVVYLSADDTIQEGASFGEGAVITTQNGVTVQLPDGSDVELDQNTVVRVASLRSTATQTLVTLHLKRGAVRSRVTRSVGNAPPTVFTVVTPVASAGVRGTDFSVAYEPPPATATVPDADLAEVDVFEGTVAVEREGATQEVGAGDGATVNRRAILKRRIAEKVRERWAAQREAILDRIRKRLNLGPDDDVAEKLRERLKNLTPEQRERIKERIHRQMQETKERVAARVRAARQNQKPPRRPLVAPANRRRR